MANMSGYPEWDAEGQAVEKAALDSLAGSFELYGYAPLRTRAVETIDTLLGKGETSGEIMTIGKLGKDPQEATEGLRFDLTVPLARYVGENARSMAFPYRRYQMQQVWRGERPQAGRYKEFLQADVDIVGDKVLPEGAEAEVAVVVGEALTRMGAPRVSIRANSRKILEGFFEGIGAAGSADLLRALDKLLKIGPEKVSALLQEAGASQDQAAKCLALASIKGDISKVRAEVAALGVSSSLLTEGLDELEAVIVEANAGFAGLVSADLSIARGLDYYTGVVFESQMEGYENLGSVASGGRYESLISGGAYPGVGMSIGLTRVLGGLLKDKAITASRQSPSCVLVALDSTERRAESVSVARSLRSRGIAAEVSASDAKYGKQILYADRKGIPFVWFPGASEVKDIRTGEQVSADPLTWAPPANDQKPSLAGRKTSATRTREVGMGK